MRQILLFFLFLICVQHAAAQNLLQQYRQLAKAEKRWVRCHLFVAKRAMQCTRLTEQLYEQAKKDSLITGPENGGKPDAFRHALWMALLTQNIGAKKALKLGIAHEKANFEFFLKKKNEYGELPDSMGSVMDVLNNQKGADLGLQYSKDSAQSMVKVVLRYLTNGELCMMKTDQSGRFLTCENQPINMENYSGQWNIPKCLVSTTWKL
jgi:hypothetical protein